MIFWIKAAVCRGEGPFSYVRWYGPPQHRANAHDFSFWQYFAIIHRKQQSLSDRQSGHAADIGEPGIFNHLQRNGVVQADAGQYCSTPRQYRRQILCDPDLHQQHVCVRPSYGSNVKPEFVLRTARVRNG